MTKKSDYDQYEVNDETETKSMYVYFTNEFKTNGFGICMHVLAVIALLAGFITTSTDGVLYAIFFEVVALNCRYTK